ncbi:hypothetical protein HHK36_003179 [Tetracentron sinense]|uniref:Bromo domain-containing protein n=1 Tax=Tetracentron sinense TaxID=13715 RepID=A0A834ZXU4_TETSI|nr:hypothetical protein HHK36_003179 [Tetracentron sinense]
MGGKVVERKKKKGRPSLLDLQKRNLRQQDEQHQKQQNKRNFNPYSNPNFTNPIISNPNPNRRITRRNANSDGISAASQTIEDNDDDDENGKQREKKLKLVLRLPLHEQQRSSVNSPSLNSRSYDSDSNAEDENGETPHKRQKINAVGDGSGHVDGEKEEKPNSASKATDSPPGTLLDRGPTTPLPDKKLLVFIVDTLQKKDTRGVFSEPADPKQLPDYHEVIAHPMDFGTVRKKLAGGAYANLEQFEKDIFLICSNAMQYNAPDTIYFRQARSIQVLAKKSFENLRQDSDDNKPEPKIVRRGRPPSKNLKKPLGRPPFEHAGSSDATLATGGDNANWSNSYDLRKGPLSDKSGPVDASGRNIHGSRNSVAHTSWLAEHKSDRNDEFPGSMLRGAFIKYGKKQFVFDENRRNTYKQPHLLTGGREASVLTTFEGEKQQLMTVGLHSDHGYARSLTRFAANLGPFAWKIASKKIERALPAGLKFGPGWVGENDAAPQQLPLSSSSPIGQLPPRQPLSLPNVSLSSGIPSTVESNRHKSSEKQGPSNYSVLDSHSSRALPIYTAPSSSPAVANRSPEPAPEGIESVKVLNSQSGLHLLNSSVDAIRHRPPFQIHQSPVIHPTINGFRGGFSFNLSSQMEKLGRPVMTTGKFSSDSSMALCDSTSRSDTNFVHPMPANRLDSEDPRLSESSNRINSGGLLLDSGSAVQAASGARIRQLPSWQVLPLHQKPDSVPPDLNVGFQSPGSPSSSIPVDLHQPDLALQLLR